MSSEKASKIDGRTARSIKTRSAVVRAMLDLVDEGAIEPTAVQIAARAGVSDRLVFHHFADLEALYASAADVQMRRMAPLMKHVDTALPFADRLALFVESRAVFFERLSPARRSALRREPFSPQMARGLATAHRLSRNQALEAFNPELEQMTAEAREEISTALSAATSWENWDYLRRREALSVADASKVVARAIRSLLSGSINEVRSKADI